MEISSSDALPHFEATSDDIGIAIDVIARHLPMARHAAQRRLCGDASVALLLGDHGGDPRLEPGFQQRMRRGWTHAPVATQLLFSVDDVAAREFEESAKMPTAGSGVMARPELRRVSLPCAIHLWFGADDQRVGVAAPLDIQCSPPGGNAVAPTLSAVHFTEDMT